ncbi:C-GCAxxG-C-C family protein [Cuneatibacter caecimuris]|uniref:C_GCAxxG_C_C family probable redox protein n=1 Tax=Cuneatibacter caecimuris TaxID=1796618 RepID=A0A4Q7PLK3_9FIRM|nr:C-GCAxxG-C-C family protein [Cuneatibacter caecimuris]RZT01217.1 C_GCAxxG_C_C family probable redox protein [Cuneatibacter caecimuris]
MESRVQKALDLRKKGYTCSQAVACTYCDLAGVDEKTMFRIMEGYGLGMGCMEGTCGSISGAVALAGLKQSTGNLEKPDSKAETYKLAKAIMTVFREKNGATVCRDLKGMETKKLLRDCNGCIEDACLIVEQLLFQEKAD